MRNSNLFYQKRQEKVMTLFRNDSFNIKKFLKKAKKFNQFESKNFEEMVQYYESSVSQVLPKKLGLKLVVISDTHGDLAFENRFEQFMNNIPEYDLVVILGDIYCYELVQITKIIPVDKIIGLRGNHDSFDIYDKYGIKNINGHVFNYKGVKLAGIEGSFRYKKEEFPSFTHYESLKLVTSMLQEADVLLTHDCMFKESKYDIAHSGLAGITYYIFKNNLIWHIHGHIHKSYQDTYSNGTIEKSVYGCEYLEI